MIKNVSKKLLVYSIIGVLICSTLCISYKNSVLGAEAVVVGGVTAGVGLLSLIAVSGVTATAYKDGQESRLSDLSDEELNSLQTNLPKNFEEACLQNGIGSAKVNRWLIDLGNGIIDKTSECWGTFKDWAKNVNLSSNINNNTKIVENGYVVSSSANAMIGNVNLIVNSDMISSAIPSRAKMVGIYLKENASIDENYSYSDKEGVFVFSNSDIINNDTTIRYVYFSSCSTSVINGQEYNMIYPYTTYSYSSKLSDLLAQYPTIYKSYASVPCIYNGTDISDYDEPIYKPFFSTNTNYLQRLKGENEDVIDVIDVTDIKNPILEYRPNTKAEISYNRGTNRKPSNNNDDDDKMKTGLVPMDVWYEQLDDTFEEEKNAVVVYDTYIQEHPNTQGQYFINTGPITNVNNYFNTLPVVNVPSTGTIVNNNYEYNNYNNNNVTIYQEPYNTGIIPTFPDFRKKFPFCIPFDIYEFFVVFLAEKEAPKIEIPFPVLDNTEHQLTVEDITIDLAPYDYVSDVLRIMLFVAFCVGLMMVTRQLIKG